MLCVNLINPQQKEDNHERIRGQEMFFYYQRLNSKPNTIRNYELLLLKFCDQFDHRDLKSITFEEVSLRSYLKCQKPNRWKILEKEVVGEIIFRTVNPRDRLILELMAQGAQCGLGRC